MALVEAEGGYRYRACAGPDRFRTALARAWNRAKADGTVTWAAADQLAVRLLGVHPPLVWGDDWLRVLWELAEDPTHDGGRLLRAG